jgi:hypothetical protein
MEFAGPEMGMETRDNLQEFDGIEKDHVLKLDINRKRTCKRLAILPFDDEDPGWTLRKVAIF